MKTFINKILRSLRRHLLYYSDKGVVPYMDSGSVLSSSAMGCKPVERGLELWGWLGFRLRFCEIMLWISRIR